MENYYCLNDVTAQGNFKYFPEVCWCGNCENQPDNYCETDCVCNGCKLKLLQKANWEGKNG